MRTVCKILNDTEMYTIVFGVDIDCLELRASSSVIIAERPCFAFSSFQLYVLNLIISKYNMILFP